ncbi:uncharacterized protein A1O9_06146, partial [Exophiala aquamarina CBS 119918]
LTTATTVLYYVVVHPLLLLLKALWYIVAILSTPFLYIGRVLLRLSTIPWRLFTRFEALWYFLGSAILLGLLLGLLLHFTLRAFVVVCRLDRKSVPKPAPKPKSIPAKGHDALSYRKARGEKKKKAEVEEQAAIAVQARLIASQPLIQEVVREVRKMPFSGSAGPLSPSVPGPSRHGLLQETILEHTDEDDDDSVF